jgi:hypothetical protein
MEEGYLVLSSLRKAVSVSLKVFLVIGMYCSLYSICGMTTVFIKWLIILPGIHFDS